MRIFTIPVIFCLILPPQLFAQTLRPRFPVHPISSSVPAASAAIYKPFVVNGISVDLGQGIKLYKPGVTPVSASVRSQKVSQLIKTGHKEAAANACLETAREDGKLPFESLDPKNTEKPNSNYFISLQSLSEATPPLLKRDECQDNFERDRCLNLFSKALTVENQALYGSKLLNEDGTVDQGTLLKVSKNLGLTNVAEVKVRPGLKIEMSELTESLENESSGILTEVLSELLGVKKDEVKSFRSDLHESLSSTSEVDEVAEILGKPAIILFTNIIVQKIDEALANGEQGKADLYLKSLEDVNPSAARGLDCLLKSMPIDDLSKGSLAEEEKRVGPISGFDYSRKVDMQTADGGISIAIGAATLLATIVIGGITWYYSEESRDLAKNTASEATLMFLKEMEWHAPKMYPGELSTYKPGTPPPKVIDSTEPTIKTEGSANSGSLPSETNPGTVKGKEEDIKKGGVEDMWGPLAPGTGGHGGELWHPESVADAILWNELKKDREKIADLASNIRFDERQIVQFCDNVIRAKSDELHDEIRDSIHKIEEIDVHEYREGLLGTKNGVIAFDSWKFSDGARSSFEREKDRPKNCFIKFPTRRAN